MQTVLSGSQNLHHQLPCGKALFSYCGDDEDGLAFLTNEMDKKMSDIIVQFSFCAWKSVNVGEDGEYLLVLVKTDDTYIDRVASFQL